MYTGYLIYQAERTKSPAEQREIDMSNARLAAGIGRLWRAITAPVRGMAAPLRSWRAARRTADGAAPPAGGCWPASEPPGWAGPVEAAPVEPGGTPCLDRS